MKRLFLASALCLMTIAAPVGAAELISSGQIGPINYYAIHATKSLQILLPWKVQVSLIDSGQTSGSERYYLSVYGELDTSLDRPEIQSLRGKFPGYQVNDPVPTQLDTIAIDIGDSHPKTLEAPPVTQNFFSAGWFIDSNAGPAVWKGFKSGQYPAVTIQADASIPTPIAGEEYVLPLSTLCPEVKAESNVQSTLSKLVEALQPSYAKLKTADMKQLVLETAIESCIRLKDTAKISSISDVLRLPVEDQGRVEDKALSTDHVEPVTQTVRINSEVTATVHR